MINRFVRLLSHTEISFFESHRTQTDLFVATITGYAGSRCLGVTSMSPSLEPLTIANLLLPNPGR